MTTRSPRAASWRTSSDPMQPPPPVTTIEALDSLISSQVGDGSWPSRQRAKRAGTPITMAKGATIGNQKAILANQRRIMRNQRRIEANQRKLDRLLKNQRKLDRILANQRAILSRLK